MRIRTRLRLLRILFRITRFGLVKEMRLLRAGSGVEGDDAAALAERRRRPARCAGFKPLILRSTSTILLI
ncbi:hypothetical protein HanXRQr2_Chr09g0398111 [Helianthus annuus]|uniref:Uncharacterized protein n=1 Tax=Helianthus annuus TaxID=4232 RepID=A0A9K3I7W3_HELAN|nr:hypothetical protein HanXRQr2_Chr09g0398111 [Helianthus annuus]KAJ0893975.1 hypothetical protein HanPSC8_Chr09g0383851 [Helianthus annuus]